MKWTTTPCGIPFLEQWTYPEILASLSLPVFLGKNFINVVQLWKASKILVGVDLAERAAARAAALKKAEVEFVDDKHANLTS